MKDIDLIISHPLLRDDNLFTSVDDEVASLVKLTVLSTMHSVILV